jgi:hypothetical protein
MTVSRGYTSAFSACSRSRSAPVPSVEPSSTAMISSGRQVCVAIEHSAAST